MDNFLQAKIIKCFNIYINPIIIGGLFSALGNWDFEHDKYIRIKLIVLATLFLWYIFSIFRYYKIEEQTCLEIKNLKDRITALEDDKKMINIKNDAYSKTLLSLTSLFNTCAESINSIADSLLSKQVRLDNWNYKVVCTGICKGIYETICLRSGYSDFSISIISYEDKSRKCIKMIAEKGKYEGHPDIFDVPLNMKDYKTFYAVKMFKKNRISVLLNSEEIIKNFVFLDDKKEHPNYSQYAGIPIQCNNNDMISLLQICAFNDSKIAETKNEIMEIINNYILPFTYFSLLNYKMEKGFINSIYMIKEKNKNGTFKIWKNK